MGTLHRELIFLAFLIHISVNGITILLGLLLHEILASVPSSYIQALTRGGQLPTSAPSPPVSFFDGLIARSHHYLDCYNSIMIGFPASNASELFHHSLFLKPLISKIINLMLSLCLKILNGFPQNTK